MRAARIWRRVLGVDNTVIDAVGFDEQAGAVVVAVRPQARARHRCGVCRRRCPRYDGGAGRRRWRAPDWGAVPVFVEAPVPRVRCAEHAVVVAAVPWARHGAGHTYGFDATVAWLAMQTSQTAVCELMRIAWRTVGAIVARVFADGDAGADRLAGVRRIGIDEVSYKKGHKYLTVVVDHDTGRLVWAAPGHGAAVLAGFFTALGPDRCAEITHVTSDAAGPVAATVARWCPAAVRCADPFHIVAWATGALDVERRAAWNRARGPRPAARPWAGAGYKSRTRSAGDPATAAVKNSRWALLKNPEHLTAAQRDQLAWIQAHDARLFRAWQLEEQLRLILKLPSAVAPDALEAWIEDATASGLPAFVGLARSITAQRPAILATIEHRLSNGRVESVNTKIRLIVRRGFGFHTPEAVIALAMLSLGGDRPRLPGRTNPRISQ
ncbi:ISL3 family transposase [Rhodococcus aetherivorans]|uniref:ISL3 family transposase n=1 Tax=Rhodococcus aetherivorans TaxID=191292 RepID=UPI003670474A